MATRFIAYVPKPTKEKHIIKSLCKSTLKEFSTSDNNQSIEQHLLPVRVSAIENDFLTQKVNGDDGIILEESLMEIYRSSDSGDEDEDDIYFPTVQELIAGQGMSTGHAPKAVDKPALDDNDHFINPDKSILGPNSGNSLDKPVLVGEDEQNNTGSQADLSDFHTDSTKSTAGLESRQTSLDTTISSSSKPQSSEVDSKVSRAAKLRENNTFVTEIAHSKRVLGSLKHKSRSMWGDGLGDLSESQGSSSTDSDSDDSDSDDSSESEFDDRPAQKKQKTDNCQYNRKGRSTSGFQTAQTVQDELPAADNTESEYTKGCQDPFNGQDLYDGAIKLLAAVCDGELEHNDSIDGGPKDDTNIISAPQPTTAAIVSQESVAAIDGQSATLAATALMKSALDDPAIPPQVAEVANDKQEWEICDIVGKEDVDGVPHYWVQWSVTLVPKSEMGKARALVARFEAQGRQRGGKYRERLPLLKAGKQATAGARATGKTQQRRGRGRPRKQVSS